MTRMFAALVAGIILAGAAALLPGLPDLLVSSDLTVRTNRPSLLTLPGLSALPAKALPLQQAPRQGQTCPAVCVSAESALASPDLLLLGETTTVTLASKMICAGQATPLHIAILVAQSEGIGSEELREIHRVVNRLIADLDLESSPSTRLALVEAKDEARTLVSMTNDAFLLSRGLGRLSPGGAGALTEGIDAATREIRRARISQCPRPEANEILLIFASEPEGGRCPEAERAARQAKAQGVLVISVCASRSCRAARCVPRLASSPRYFYRIPILTSLIRVFVRIRDEAGFSIPRGGLEILETIPPELSYLPDSAKPPARYDPRTRSLQWFLPSVPKEGVTVTWQARPQAPGLQMTSRGAELRWTFVGYDPLTKTLAPAWVQVFGAPAP